MAFHPDIRILVIDDMMSLRKLIVNNLKEFGFTHITEASNGQDAWAKIKDAHHAYELIISDWNMPVFSGLQLLQKCKADEKTKNIPFVMLTAEAEQHQVMEALKLGVSGYIIKPFTAAILKDKLDQVSQKITKI